MGNVSTPAINYGRPNGLDEVGTLEALSGLEVVEYGGSGHSRMTEFKFTAFALAITDALAYSSQKIYTFPRGKIAPIMVTSHLAFMTTSAIATTLLTGKTVSYGFGTAAASSLTLATTMQNFLPGTGISVATFVSSAVINVVNTGGTVTHDKASALLALDGSATALPLYFNLGVAAADIDGNATLAVTGRVCFHWINTGGWAYYS